MLLLPLDEEIKGLEVWVGSAGEGVDVGGQGELLKLLVELGPNVLVDVRSLVATTGAFAGETSSNDSATILRDKVEGTYELRNRAGQNVNLQGYLLFDNQGNIRALYNLHNVAQAIGANVSALAGQTVAMIDELRDTTGPTYVRVTDPLFNRVLDAIAPTLAHLDALVGAAGDDPDFLVPAGNDENDPNYDGNQSYVRCKEGCVTKKSRDGF